MPLTPAPAPAPAAEPGCVPACRDGYVCVNGGCISACNPPCLSGETCTSAGTCQTHAYEETDLEVADTGWQRGPASGSEQSNVGFNVNLLGLFTLGPTVGLEFGGRVASFTARFRAMNAGLLSYALVADAFGDDETLGFSYGVAGMLRFYLGGRKGNMRGFFLGPGIEYVSTRVEDEDLVAYNTHLIVPEVELGYRFVWGHFLLDVGGGVGYAIVVDKNSELLSGGTTLWENDAEDSFYAVGTVAIGALF